MAEQGTVSRKLANATQRAIRNPAWLRETLRTKLRARAHRDRRFSPADHPEHLCSVAEALADAFGVSATEYRSLQSRIRIPLAPAGSAWGGGEDILNLLGSVVLLRRPSVVIETGVAMGFSTAVMLAAMDVNQAGALHSIDLPPLQVNAAEFVGEVVADELRGRWTLHSGPRERSCPVWSGAWPRSISSSTTATTATPAQHEEYRVVWPYLAGGACLISDDVSNPAFVEFAGEVGEKPYLMAPPGHDAAVGLLVKSR